MTTPKEEGPRGFGPFLSKLDEGQLIERLADELKDVTVALDRHAQSHGKAKGTLSLTLSITIENGIATIIPAVATKLPKVPQGQSVMWITPGGNLTPENPRQQKLPLREVPGLAPVVNMADATAEVRGV
jgi:hypothetical protein